MDYLCAFKRNVSMNFAIFGRSISEEGIPFLQDLVAKLETIDGKICCYEPFFRFLESRISFREAPRFFSFSSQIRDQVDFLFSIGGDGTILDAVTLIGENQIPIIGVNLGRLGFLSSISRGELLPALDEIIHRHVTLDQRTLIRLTSPESLFGDFPYALNDLTVYKSHAQTMLKIRTDINGNFLNTYWADGLIVATPTGSTAYSLSCTGPILTPDSENFVITPIASHNLTVRPIVLRDDSRIRITLGGNGDPFFVSMDSRIREVNSLVELEIEKAPFHIHLLKRSNANFFQTIREKLKWGLDVRN